MTIGAEIGPEMHLPVYWEAYKSGLTAGELGA